MKKTPLKSKRAPLKSNKNRLKVNSSLKGVGFLKIKGVEFKKTKSLQNNGTNLAKNNTELKKQNDKAKDKWEKIRNQVLERDNYKCIICGKPATHVHHIHLRSQRRDLLYEINNLVLLCSKCHNHSSTDGLEEVNKKIAKVKNMTLEELLKFAETKSKE